MQLFVLTAHCQCRAHCLTCRNKESGRKWRENLKTTFKLPDNKVDFECPYGIPWGFEPVPQNSTPQIRQPHKIQTTVVKPEKLETVPVKAEIKETVKEEPLVRNTQTRGGCGCGR